MDAETICPAHFELPCGGHDSHLFRSPSDQDTSDSAPALCFLISARTARACSSTLKLLTAFISFFRPLPQDQQDFALAFAFAHNGACSGEGVHVLRALQSSTWDRQDRCLATTFNLSQVAKHCWHVSLGKDIASLFSLSSPSWSCVTNLLDEELRTSCTSNADTQMACKDVILQCFAEAGHQSCLHHRPQSHSLPVGELVLQGIETKDGQTIRAS